MGMTDGIHLDIEDQPERKSGRNFPDVKAAAKSISKLTDEMLEEMDENPSPFEPPMVNGLMAKPDGRHPTSRDWEMECFSVKCAKTGCVCNIISRGSGSCAMPSRIKIGETGKCEGYQPRK